MSFSRRQGTLFIPKPLDNLFFEKQLYKKGVRLVAGVDEVGRGCLAGPVVAASVILPESCDIQGIDDSKKLSPAKRADLFEKICNAALSYGIGLVGPAMIDEINILQATRRAMALAVSCMSIAPEYLLIDGNQLIDAKYPQEAIIKGDSRSISVAAASIIAKVARDRLMVWQDSNYPGFSFSIHKGYGTARHVEELKRLGPTVIHRKSFKLKGY